jgi:hypothetical protein
MRFKLLLTAACALLAAAACNDFLEVDLTGETVRLQAPADGSETSKQTQQFSWQPVEGATSYEVTIVTPSFDSIGTLVALEEVETNSFSTTLAPGAYEWTVVARNSAYASAGEVFSLLVRNDSTENLAGQTVQLVAPAAGSNVNSQTVEFLWQGLPSADQYNLQVASPDFSNSTYIVESVYTGSDHYALTLPQGAYRWRVRAENDISVTLYSERGFTIDATAPAAPQLVAPTHNQFVTLPVTLSWTSDANTLRDTVYVYTDSLQSLPVLVEPTLDNTLEFNDNSSSVYFWRVRSVDAAGNAGPYSVVRKFRVQ